MSKELLFIIYLTLSGLLFTIGGTYNKAWRRYALPLVTLVFLLMCGVNWMVCVGIALARVAAYCLGYGESHTYAYKFIVFILYFLPTVILGFNWWLLFGPVLIITAFKLSNLKLFENSFKWKSVEFMMGTLVAVADISTIN